MVVGPVSATDPSWENVAPLYGAFLRPRNETADLWADDAFEGLLGRFWFDVKLQGKEGWQPMPELWMKPNTALPAKAATALEDMTHLRIFFPVGERLREIPVTQSTQASSAPVQNTP
jgi:hypothetical protein